MKGNNDNEIRIPITREIFVGINLVGKKFQLGLQSKKRI